MADKKLNSVSPVTDAAYVYAETSNGDIVKISKADLASVVAGMIGLEFVKRATSGDLNNDTTTGYYFINTWSGHINGPASVNGIGALLVFNIQMSSTCVCQLLILNTGMYSRRYWDGSWSEWKL